MSASDARGAPRVSGASAPPPSRRARLGVALAIGLASGAFTAFCLATAPIPSDFEFWWRAARLWTHGVDPYLLAPGAPGWPLPDRFFYPLPAVLVTVPFATLPLAVAGGLMSGAAAALLAWALTAEQFGLLWLFASPSFVMALKVGQWSPLLCAAALLPALGWLAVVKPTIGAAALTYRPTWRAVLGAVAFAAVSVAFLPSWPRDWLANLRSVVAHPAPVLTPLGAPVLLALLRWRRPEARLLVAMACVPQLLFFSDQLPVALVARTRSQAATLAMCAVLAWLGWWARLRTGDLYVQSAAPWVIVGVYFPALVMVLLRPNDGVAPAWAERAAHAVRERLPVRRRAAGARDDTTVRL